MKADKPWVAAPEDHEDCAREIEQLRSKLADAVERYQKFSDNLTGPRDAEIERLRTVLADKERLAHRLAAECVERLEDQTRLRAELAGVKRMVKGVNMETESEIDRLQRDNVIYRACANGYAESALRALMDMTGSYNKDNPWLGVTAAVALLHSEVERLRAVEAAARLAAAEFRGEPVDELGLAVGLSRLGRALDTFDRHKS